MKTSTNPARKAAVEKMTDLTFLTCCDLMSLTDVCALESSELSRLMKLAGKNDAAELWSAQSETLYEVDGVVIQQHVETARGLMGMEFVAPAMRAGGLAEKRAL